MKVFYSVCGGPQKAECEDTALIENTVVTSNSAELILPSLSRIAVLDGVGGRQGGAKASRFVAEKLLKTGMPETVDGLRERLVNINGELISYGRKTGLKEMATTLTGLLFTAGETYIIHAGNTRIYAIKNSVLKQITEDQTSYQVYMSLGYTDYAENCKKNELRCAFGGGNPKYIDMLCVGKVFENSLPDFLLFTTDGVHDCLSFEEIGKIMCDDRIPVHAKAKQITDCALAKGSMDDRTAILTEMHYD